jgi:hypothetical protein
LRSANLFAALTFVVLTALLTYPQVRDFATSVPYHSDPYFSIWRLGWVAHAIRKAPGELFDANIFYPERLTLAYSDAMLLPGVVLAPLFWVGTNPIVIYNLTLFVAFALSGLTVFSLARLLTGDVSASLVAGVIFAFAPYRFTHYRHLELQMVFWIPLLLFTIHRSLPRVTVRDGVLMGGILGLQLLSCIYVGIFAAVFCVVFVPCLLAVTGARRWRTWIMPLMVGAMMTTVLALPYAQAYTSARGTVGTRSIEQFRLYSASLQHYLSAPQMNRLYGGTAITDPLVADEMNLFPGVLTVALALTGAFGSKARSRYAYVAGLIFAIVMTAGANGLFYEWLFEHVTLFRALRSPARFGIFVILCLAVLSAYGVAALRDRIGSARGRLAVTGAVMTLLVTEYASAPTLAPAPMPSKVDAYLAQKPPVVIVELPVMSNKGTFGSLDWLYMYQGLPHFQKMLNGYSGYAPASFYEMREVMSSFPDDRSIALLRNRRVDYVVVRAGLYDNPNEAAVLLEEVRQRKELSLEAMWTEEPDGREALFQVVSLPVGRLER